MVRKALVTVLILLLLSGCMSTELKRYIGMPIQEAAINYGTPTTMFDMPDGSRVFQWMKTTTYTMPTSITTTGSAVPFGGSVWYAQNAQISGGQQIQSQCAYTLIANWSDTTKAWMVTSYRLPRQLVC